MADSFDLRILEALQRDSRISVEALAEDIGLSAPASYRRIRALRETGAIERETALVAPATMGWGVTMIVLVTLERDHGRIVDAFVRRLRECDEVIDIWYVTGDHDLILHVAARDMAGYDDFTRRELHVQGLVQSFKTSVVIRHSKRAAALPPAPASGGDAARTNAATPWSASGSTT